MKEIILLKQGEMVLKGLTSTAGPLRRSSWATPNGG